MAPVAARAAAPPTRTACPAIAPSAVFTTFASPTMPAACAATALSSARSGPLTTRGRTRRLTWRRLRRRRRRKFFERRAWRKFSARLFSHHFSVTPSQLRRLVVEQNWSPCHELWQSDRRRRGGDRPHCLHVLDMVGHGRTRRGTRTTLRCTSAWESPPNQVPPPSRRNGLVFDHDGGRRLRLRRRSWQRYLRR